MCRRGEAIRGVSVFGDLWGIWTTILVRAENLPCSTGFRSKREVHDHFIGLRTKFGVHSVNAYEQTLPYAVLHLSDGELEHTGTAHLLAEPLNRERAQKLERLARAFSHKAMQEKTRLGAALYDETKAMCRDALERLPELTVETPNVESGHRHRK